MSYEVIREPSTKVTLGVRRLSDLAMVPKDTANADWQIFLAWNAQQSPPLDVADGTLTLPERQAQRAETLAAETKRYIESHYPEHKQRSLSHLRITATGTPATLIDSVWSWIADVIAYYYQKEDAIVLADDLAEVNAITWDFAQFDASDPEVTLRSVMGISSSSSA